MMSSAGLLTRVARSVYARSMSFSQGTRGFCSASTGTEAANSNAKTAGERVLNDYLRSTSEEEERRELERVLAQRQSRRHAAGDGDEDGRVRAEGGLDGAADSGQSLSAAQVEAEAAEARRAAARARRLRRADGPNPMAVAIGRRKASVAKVYLTGVDVEAEQYPDTYDPHHSATVNGMPAAQYFGNDVNAVGSALMPLLVTNYARPSWRVEAKVRGGGTTGQAGAIRLALARALDAFNFENNHAIMKHNEHYADKDRKSSGDEGIKYHLFTRDPRMVERKKPGKPKARKSFQWVKR